MAQENAKLLRQHLARAQNVREQVADGHLVGNVRVVHLETGETLIDAIVPGDCSFVDQGGQGCGGESFGIGADAEESVLVDPRGIAEFADAVTFGEHDVAVFDDGDSDARYLERCQNAGDIGVEIGGLGTLTNPVRRAA